MILSMLLALPMLAQCAPAEAPPDLGNHYPFLRELSGQCAFALSHLNGDWKDTEEWRRLGRDKMRELLRYDPAPAPLAPEVLESARMDGYTRHLVRYQVAADRRTEAYLLVPDNLSGPAPAVMMLHCHSGEYWFGKEKVASIGNPPPVLRELWENNYGGRPPADALARRGYVVLAPDAFYFGSQRLDPALMPENAAPELKGLEPGTDGYIRAFDRIASRSEQLMAKTLFLAGATWPGVLFQGDRAGLDYLLTRPEVDGGRVGCAGLSIGGFRSAHLFGLDGRIAAAVVAGWMTTYPSLLRNHVLNHTWMIYVPGQCAWLDLPDAASLNAPGPLMVVNCAKDTLFTMEGMRAAGEKLAAVYGKMGAADRFDCRFYDEPHSFKVPAQEDAFAWLDRWLRK